MNFLTRFTCSLLGIWVLAQPLFADSYRYFVDLRQVEEDRLAVELIPPALRQDSLIFQFPAIVPGTYSIYDFGRFISDFQATDMMDQSLPVERIDDNAWLIRDARRLQKISYQVDDTWDAFDKGNFVFEPGGTNIERGSNFVINGHGFFGYFRGFQELPFELSIQKPEGFYGATALVNQSQVADRDSFVTGDYFDLVDAPIMYCVPDTTLIEVGGAEVLFAIYSPGQEVDSKEVANEVREILEAQKEYLGGELPIKRYAFIIYLFDHFGGSGAYGALEHNTSSLYFLPEFAGSYLSESIRDFAAHEFFHIVTPLNIHSEHIHHFNFVNPRMSRHLWLYEGVTEYSAGHVQIRHGLIDLEEYLEKVLDQIESAEDYQDDLPFTEMSEGCLDTYEDQYGNVYQKGALIGLCLDLLLRKESEGSYGLQNLMQDLANDYGPEKPFMDSLLFDVIEEKTYPSVGDFFERHVAGKQALPISELLEEVGILYRAEMEVPILTLGGADVAVNNEGQIEVKGVEDLDAFGEKLGYKEGDILLEFNGTPINKDNAQDEITAFFEKIEFDGSQDLDEEVEFLVLRAKKPGKKRKKKVKLKAKLFPVSKTLYNVLTPIKDASPEQLSLRKAWIGQ